MQYASSRLCLLRLGQPRQNQINPIRHLLSPRLPFQISRREAVHGVASNTEQGSHAVFEEQSQHEGAPTPTTDAAALSPISWGSANQPQGDASRSPLDTSYPPYGGDKMTVRPVYGHEPPKPPFPLPTPSTSTLTPSDTRLQFVKEVKNIEDGTLKMASVIHRFDDWERFQRKRLQALAPGSKTRLAFGEFTAWKRFVGQFRNAPPEDSRPSSSVEKNQVRWLQGCGNVEEMMDSIPRFQGKNRSLRRRRDSQLISVALRFVPEKLRPLLECVIRTHEPPYTPEFYVVEDVLEILAMRMSVMEPSERPAVAADLALLVTNVLRSSRANTVQINQATIVRILEALPEASIGPWYQQLRDTHCNLHTNTELQFASRLAKSPSTKKLSTQVLLGLTSAGTVDINSPVAASVCTSILTFRKEDLAALDGQSATPADLFGTLHSIGMVPDVVTYSAIMRALCLRGDLKAALDVFEVMKQHGVQPDAVTFSVLIHGCKMCGDFDTLSELTIQACFANIRDPIVWNDVLHALYISCLRARKDRQGPRRTALFALNSIYTRIFDPKPIRPFITKRLVEMGDFATLQSWVPENMTRIAAEVPPLPPQELVQPGSDTLAIMILGLIRSLPMPADVVIFYSHFRQMLAEGHPVAELMVRERGTFVHDVVLRNLIKWRGTLRIALDIIRDMVRDVGQDSTSEVGHSDSMSTTRQTSGSETPCPEAHQAEDGQDTDAMMEDFGLQAEAKESPNNEVLGRRRPPIRHPAPSVYTWSILMHGFMRHKQPEEAERVISLMREHGVEPNAVTWNTLAAGYAKMEKIPKAVDAMRRLETEGFQADDWTLRAFSYINHKAKAIKLMEATVEANKLKKMALEQQQQQQQQQEYDQDMAFEEQWPAEQVPDQTQQDDGAADVDAETEEWQHSDDDEEALDEELETRLLQLDPAPVPENVSRKMLLEAQKMENIAPVNQGPQLAEWARIRRDGLSAVSGSTTPHGVESRSPLGGLTPTYTEDVKKNVGRGL